MKKITDFLKTETKLIQNLSSKTQLEISGIANSIPVDKRDEIQLFSKKVDDLVFSEELINEVEKSILPPVPGESKEMFVKRSLEKLKRILSDKFL